MMISASWPWLELQKLQITLNLSYHQIKAEKIANLLTTNRFFFSFGAQEVAARDEGEKLIVKFDDLTLPAQKSGNATA